MQEQYGQQYPPGQHRYDPVYDSESPPPLKPKKNILRSPLKALRNVIAKTTKPLRQASFREPSEKKRSQLRRQHSMMEQRSQRMYYEQDYYEYQKQQHYNYYIHQQQQQQRQGQGYPPEEFRNGYDPRADYYRHERFYPNEYPRDPVYDNYTPPPQAQQSRSDIESVDESIYANRALIELEKPRVPPNRLVRRHSMKERGPMPPGIPQSYSTLTKKYQVEARRHSDDMVIDEPIYQSKSGSYMLDEHSHRRSYVDPSVHELKRSFEMKPIDDNEKLLQARKELLQSPVASTPTSTSSTSSPSKERNLKSSRRQLKEQIYQSRLETMQSMAEPIYVTRNGNNPNAKNCLRSQPIYESKKESEDHDHSVATNEAETSNENENTKENEKSLLEAIEETIKLNKSQEMIEQSGQEIPFMDDGDQNGVKHEEHDEQINSSVSNKKSNKIHHISNIIKRTAPLPPIPISTAATNPSVYNSHTSIETQYTSQASIAIGPPNASSTPYASTDLSMLHQKRNNLRDKFFGVPPLREPITTRGVFDERGGLLEDKVWNVSLYIPPNALPPGSNQEIYFTVTDPRSISISESERFGGPPLDLENG